VRKALFGKNHPSCVGKFEFEFRLKVVECEKVKESLFLLCVCVLFCKNISGLKTRKAETASCD
jgi:hypothetical protein